VLVLSAKLKDDWLRLPAGKSSLRAFTFTSGAAAENVGL
jgi:hypothetical protein